VSKGAVEAMAQEKTHYIRFSVAQRLEHLLLIASFTALAVTGLPQKFVGNALAEGFIALLGGIEMVRTLHHIAAIVLALETVYHVIVLAYKVFVRRVEMTMLPVLKDITDALDIVRFNLGLTRERAKLPRYSYEEKAEYWAMIWGTLVMGLTGFMLWNPIATARFLPGQVIPAAKAAHGGEAILAVLAILVWHFYHVHLKVFNKSIFTGKLDRHQMEHEHGAELEQLERGLTRPAPRPEVLRKRELLFIPVATVIAVLGALFVYWFATFEETAIATVPPVMKSVPAFAPLTPTPVSTPPGGVDNAKIGAAITHDIAGKEQCLTCHGGKGSLSPMPADHEGRPVASCLVCHRPGPTPTPGPTRASGAATPAAAPAAKAVPANHTAAADAFKDCVACHGPGKMKPGPASHAAFTNDTCATCHKPAGAAAPTAGATPAPAAGAGKAVPANHAAAADTFKDCVACHGPGKMKPGPASHAAFTNDTCATCHKPAPK